jgi:His-Xaa-Ser system radical SAM maturase HxsC
MGESLMLKLHGRLPVLSASGTEPYLITVTRNTALPAVLRNRHAILATDSKLPEGFRAVLTGEPAAQYPSGSDVFQLGAEYEYLSEGDIVRLDPVRGYFRSEFRRASPHNTILLTEQCNHYCLMCSQPPKAIDDSWLLREASELISMLPPDTGSIGFSGGEPTLYGDGLIDILAHTKRMLPNTAVDLLSNGRAFADSAYARKYAAVAHPDLQVDIPIYSDDPVRHDYVVQCEGAFDETIRGVINLKQLGQKVGIRIVIHRQTIDRLVKTCEFIARNLIFVDHVALMGLEITGFTRANLNDLWIDPYDYKDTLSEAIALLNAYDVNASVYNHQLCVVNSDILSNYRKSISDWKNEFLDECNSCKRLAECGGLFSSAKMYKHSSHIRAMS